MEQGLSSDGDLVICILSLKSSYLAITGHLGDKAHGMDEQESLF